MSLKNLYDFDFESLEKHLTQLGQPRYRTQQVWEWLYRHLVTDINDMTSLPKALRTKLLETTALNVPHVPATQESLDGETRKDLLEFADGERAEVVLMRYIDRRSVCISTQVGCAVGCRFCATGQMGFQRNLTSGEIVAQVLHFARELHAQEQRVTNVVFMGMGEPLLNYKNTLAALRRLTHPQGFQLGQRRITVSTVGIPQNIRRFADAGLQVNLAVSLHAATDALRSHLMPINQKHDLNTLFGSLGDYIAKTNRRVTFEWALIEGVNDTREQAETLSARISGMLAHVNLIPLNPTPGFEGQPSSPERVQAFAHVLERHYIPHSLRLRRGIGIQAGCGQLRRGNM